MFSLFRCVLLLCDTLANVEKSIFDRALHDLVIKLIKLYINIMNMQHVHALCSKVKKCMLS